MLNLVVTLLIIALIAAVLGFGGIAGAAVEIAKIVFFVAIVLFLIAAIFGAIGGRRPVAWPAHAACKMRDTLAARQANSMITASTARLSPGLALIALMTPSRSARSTFSIFMASTTASVSPALTSCPSSTAI